MTQVWQCGFCNETQQNRGKIKKHEKECMYNPDNRICLTCSKYISGILTCKENIRVYNVYTSRQRCILWEPKIDKDASQVRA